MRKLPPAVVRRAIYDRGRRIIRRRPIPRGTKPGAARGTFKDPRYLGEAAQRLRALRARSGLTQKQVAEAVGIRERAVYEWEKGERIPMAVLPEIAEVFQTSTSFILYGVDPADETLAGIRTTLDELRREQRELREEVAIIRERVHDIHEALAGVTEEVASTLEEVADRVAPEVTRDGDGHQSADPPLAPSAPDRQ